MLFIVGHISVNLGGHMLLFVSPPPSLFGLLWFLWPFEEQFECWAYD